MSILRIIIWLWVIGFGATLLLISIVYNPTWSFGDIVQAIVGSLALLGGVGFLVRWAIIKCLAAQLFTIEEQSSQCLHNRQLQTSALDSPQRANLTMRLKLNTHVEFVALWFEGQGETPKIVSLDDWQHPPGEYSPNVYRPYSLPDGRWYWQYHTPWHRKRKARITIGMTYCADEPFTGHLMVRITCEEASKDKSLPIVVLPMAAA